MINQELSTASWKARRRSGFQGVTKLRKTLRRLEPEATKEIKAKIARGAQDIKDDAVRGARNLDKPGVGTGEMIRSITYTFGRDGMTALIGPGADRLKVSKSPFNTTLYKTKRDKEAAFNFFKAYWFEFGTKGYPKRNIPPQPARPFMNPAWDMNKDDLIRDIRAEVAKALKVAASG